MINYGLDYEFTPMNCHNSEGEFTLTIDDKEYSLDEVEEIQRNNSTSHQKLIEVLNIVYDICQFYYLTNKATFAKMTIEYNEDCPREIATSERVRLLKSIAENTQLAEDKRKSMLDAQSRYLIYIPKFVSLH